MSIGPVRPLRDATTSFIEVTPVSAVGAVLIIVPSVKMNLLAVTSPDADTPAKLNVNPLVSIGPVRPLISAT